MHAKRHTLNQTNPSTRKEEEEMIVIINKHSPKLTKAIDTSLYSIQEIVAILAIYTSSRDFDVEIGNLDNLFTNLKKGN